MKRVSLRKERNAEWSRQLSDKVTLHSVSALGTEGREVLDAILAHDFVAFEGVGEIIIGVGIPAFFLSAHAADPTENN